MNGFEAADANPYVAPVREDFSPALSQAERDLLTYYLDFRESPYPTRRVISRAVAMSLLCSPLAAVFALSFGLGVYGLTNATPFGAVAFASVAFASAMSGFFLRDVGEALSSAQIQAVQIRVSDFAEVERLLYGQPQARLSSSRLDEPLAAIPVEVPGPAGLVREERR
jgi:hypothetical protein